MSRTHVSVFGSSQSQPGDSDYEDAVRLGGLLAERGFAVINGGYAGLMEAVSVGAARAGGEVLGVTVPSVFLSRTGANSYLTSELAAPNLVARIGMMLELSSAAIALPGSLGTLTELLMAWNVNFVARFSEKAPKPIITVGSVWSDVVPMLTERVVTDGDLITCVDTVDAAVTQLDIQMTRNSGH